MKCHECDTKTKEFLVFPSEQRKLLFLKWESARSKALCREHLIQHFRREFTQAPQRMVVFYPNLEEKNGNYQYCFVRLKEIEKAYAPDAAMNATIMQKIQSWLDLVHGNCSRCPRAAQVAYFGKEAVEWKEVPGYLNAPFDYLMIQEVSARPEILCAGFAFDRIERSFRIPVRGFEDGVYCPHGTDEGVYLTVEV